MSDDERNLPATQKAINFFKKRSDIQKAVADVGRVSNADETSTGPMTNDRINGILSSNNDVTKLSRHAPGQWAFQYQGRAAYIMTDDRPGIDRMRVMALITDDPARIDAVSPERLLAANCHEALDARFCYEGDGSLWAAFIHPLSTLTERDLISGMKQVTHLAVSYPRSLSSLDIVFRGTSPEQQL